MPDKHRNISYALSFSCAALLSALTFFTFFDPGNVSFLFFGIVTVSLLAAASSPKVQYYIMLAAPFFSFFALVLLKKDPVWSLTVFLPYLFPTILLELVIKRKHSRSVVLTICSVAVSALIILASMYVAGAFGPSPVESVKNYYSGIISGAEGYISKAFIISVAGKEVSILSSDYLNRIIDSVIVFAPACMYLLIYSLFFICSSFMYQQLYDRADDDIFERWILKSEPSSFAVVMILTVAAAIVSKGYIFIALATTDAIVWTGLMFDGLSSSFRKRIVPGELPRRPFLRPALLIISGMMSMFAIPVTSAVFAAHDCIKRIFPREKNDESDENDRGGLF